MLAALLVSDIVSAPSHLAQVTRCESNLGSNSRVDVRTALRRARLRICLRRTLNRRIWRLVLLTRGINRNLNRDLTPLHLLTIHLRARLLLQLLTRERDEPKSTALARLVAGLQLADHVFRDRAQGDLRGGRAVLGKDLEKLLFVQVVGEVRDHNLGLGWDAVLWWAALLALTRSAGLAGLGWVDVEGALGAWRSGEGLVGGRGQGSSLARDVGWAGAVGGWLNDSLAVSGSLTLLVLAVALGARSTATTSTAAATRRRATTRLTLSAFGTLSRSSSRLWLAGELDGDLAVEDGLAVELADSTLGLGWGRYVDEGVADWAGGAWVGWDGCGLAEQSSVSLYSQTNDHEGVRVIRTQGTP